LVGGQTRVGICQEWAEARVEAEAEAEAGGEGVQEGEVSRHLCLSH